MDIFNPDTTITASDLESFALEYLTELPVRGVEGRTLDPDDAWATVLHAAVEQTSIHDITEQTTDTPCSDRVLEWLATVEPNEFEDTVNDALARQARQMLLKATPRSICLDFVDIHYHGRHHLTKAELCTTTPPRWHHQVPSLLRRLRPLSWQAPYSRVHMDARQRIQRRRDQARSWPRRRSQPYHRVSPG